jgi:hypothetical protein
MYFRVVRFTDVTADRIDRVKSRVDESDGPPPGVPAKAVQILFDESQGTALAILSFETAEDMRKGDEGMNALDPADTPGTRASVDMCELMVERQA